MQVIKQVRQDMLEDRLWVDIVAGFTGLPLVGKVEFVDSGGVPLCELEFDDMEIVSNGTDNSIMRLKSIDGSYILKSTVHTAGTVSEFKIWGSNPHVIPQYILIGTVGTLTSSAELRFNIVNWVIGTFVSIENFDIIIPNGV